MLDPFLCVRCVLWIIVGGVAGSLAGQIMRGRSFGFVGDVILGLVGSVVGGIIFNLINLNLPGGLFAICSNLVVATVGAVIVIFVASILTGRSATR